MNDEEDERNKSLFVEIHRIKNEAENWGKLQAQKQFYSEKGEKPRKSSLPRIAKPFFIQREEDPLKDNVFKNNILKRPKHLKEKLYTLSRNRRINSIMENIVDSEINESPAKLRVKELLNKITVRNESSRKHRRFYSMDLKKDKGVDSEDAKWHYKYQAVHVNRKNLVNFEYDFSKENARRMLPKILKEQDESVNNSKLSGNQLF